MPQRFQSATNLNSNSAIYTSRNKLRRRTVFCYGIFLSERSRHIRVLTPALLMVPGALCFWVRDAHSKNVGGWSSHFACFQAGWWK